jgi:vacuolar-type H+-ATPase subunit E/Vma4
MEELQSTEILDREILEDARKKASRILKAADETSAANAALWDKKTEEALAELRDRYALMREKTSAEIMARLPLDERRARSEIIEGLLSGAAEEWVSGLGRERVLAILEHTLLRYIAEYPEIREEKSIAVFLHNLPKKDAEPLLKKLFPSAEAQYKEEPALHRYPEIIIDTKKVRITSSIKMLLDSLLLDKREELVSALIGESAEGGKP